MNILSIKIFLLCTCWLILFNKPIDANEDEPEWDFIDEEMAPENTGYSSQYTTVVIEDVTTVPTNDVEDIDPPELSTSDDVIELNVGGQRMTTLRSTLTAVPNSALARRFAKGNENKANLTRNENFIYFYDYNPVQFEYLLDQLRTIKRMPNFHPYDLNIVAPDIDVRFNFSSMLDDLGLNADHFLSPRTGVHLNLSVKSLVGWKECYRSTYNRPFALKILTGTCKGGRLLVACRPASDKSTLTLAGIGKREHLFDICNPYSHCTTNKRNGTGFYQVPDRAWGFDGLPRNQANGIYNQHYASVYAIPCDSSDTLSQYRLCWSFHSSAGRGGGDRCGTAKNLHNTKEWERVIYQTV